jgi:hypothetical protein
MTPERVTEKNVATTIKKIPFPVPGRLSALGRAFESKVVVE